MLKGQCSFGIFIFYAYGKHVNVHANPLYGMPSSPHPKGTSHVDTLLQHTISRTSVNISEFLGCYEVIFGHSLTHSASAYEIFAAYETSLWFLEGTYRPDLPEARDL